MDAREIVSSLAWFLPELVLTAALLLVVLIDAARIRWRAESARFVTLLALSITLVLCLRSGSESATIWHGMLVVDPLARFFKGILIAAPLLIALASTFSNSRELAGLGRGEFYALLLAATLSSLLLASANDLTILYLSLETLSISSYVLAAYVKGDRMSNEASLKYLLFGAACTGAMLYGLSLLYGLTGATRLTEIQSQLSAGLDDSSRMAVYAACALIFAGFGFKTAAVPFHFWCPDVYEGAPTPVTTYLSIAPKAAGLAILTRFFYIGLSTPGLSRWDLVASIDWPGLLMVVSALTMTVGNLAALTQNNMKRLLAYSSITHAGFMLMGVVALSEEGARSVLVYLFAYLFMNVGAFLVVALVHGHAGSFDLRDYPGLHRRAPLLTLAMAVFLLSLMGIPPFVGFFGKLYVFSALIAKGAAVAHGQPYYALAVIGALNAALAAYYYTRVLKVMIVDRESEERATLRLPFADSFWLLALAALNLLPVFAWGIVHAWARAAAALPPGAP